MLQRPRRDEYADYYHGYVDIVPDGDIVATLAAQAEESLALLGELSPERAAFAYAPGKWTLKEVLGHVIDIEWVFSYRALSFARGQQAPLPGVDQDELVALSGAASRELPDLLAEFEHLRAANARLFRAFDADALKRRGEASGHEVSVRALLWIIAGHERHHLNVIRERYLS